MTGLVFGIFKILADGKECFWMSYLLPLPYTQYQDYQNRIKGVKYNYRRTMSVDKVKRLSLSPYLNRKTAVNHTKNYKPGRRLEKVYAGITGIGGRFDAKV
jgi:hypothetical protein